MLHEEQIDLRRQRARDTVRFGGQPGLLKDFTDRVHHFAFALVLAEAGSDKQVFRDRQFLEGLRHLV